jgi:hypothetical protein
VPSEFGVREFMVHVNRDIAKPDFLRILSGDQQRILWVTKRPDTGSEGHCKLFGP